MPKNNHKNHFEDDMKRLEEVVSQLEIGIGIEEAIKLYEEGMGLTKNLEQRLQDIERKVYQVKNIEKVDKGEDEKLEMDLFSQG